MPSVLPANGIRSLLGWMAISAFLGVALLILPSREETGSGLAPVGPQETFSGSRSELFPFETSPHPSGQLLATDQDVPFDLTSLPPAVLTFRPIAWREVHNPWPEATHPLISREVLWETGDARFPYWRSETISPAGDEPSSGDDAWVAMAGDRLLLSRFSKTTNWSEVVASLQGIAGELHYEQESSWNAVFLAQADTTEELLGLLPELRVLLQERLAGLVSVDWDYFVFPTAEWTGTDPHPSQMSSLPNDPLFFQQWALERIGAPAAWVHTTGSPDTVVAILDSGLFAQHPDLVANVWVHPGEAPDGTDTDGNGKLDDLSGWNFPLSNNHPVDTTGHGTAVAGIIGAVGNNFVGGSGINWQVGLLPLKIGDQSFAWSDIVAAIDYVVDLKVERSIPVQIMNMSFGAHILRQTRNEPTPLFLALQRAQAAGIVAVCAAGNFGRNNDALYFGLRYHFFPSDTDLPNILSVANTTSADILSSTSNYGPLSVAMAAPGTGLWTTTLDGGYSGTHNGTSFSAAMVSGALALLQSWNPDVSPLDWYETVVETGTVLSSLQGKLRTPVRLRLSSAMDVALMYPKLDTHQTWEENKLLPAWPIPVLTVAFSSGDPESVRLLPFQGAAPINGSLDDNGLWKFSLAYLPAGPHLFQLEATTADRRSIRAALPRIMLADPYLWWLESISVGGSMPQAGHPAERDAHGFSLLDAFFYGFIPGQYPTGENHGLSAAQVRLHPVHGSGFPPGKEISFWQGRASLYARVIVEAWHSGENGYWQELEILEDGREEHGTVPDRVLRRLRVSTEGVMDPVLFRVRFDHRWPPSMP